jgi:hypothetical protein
MGSDHLRGHHTDRRRRGGDLPGCLGGPWSADDHAAALPDLHAVRVEPHAGAHRNAETHRHAETDCERQGDADRVTHSLTNRGAATDGDAHRIQSRPRELPNPAATADAASHAHAQPDRDRDSPDPDAKANPDPRTDDPTELDAAPHCHTHADPLTGRTVPARLRARKGAGYRSQA